MSSQSDKESARIAAEHLLNAEEGFRRMSDTTKDHVARVGKYLDSRGRSVAEDVRSNSVNSSAKSR